MVNHRNILKQFPWLVLVTLFTFIGCNKDVVADDTKFENTIDFENLRVGQKAYYVMYTANSYTYLDGFKYTGDSLKLEVKKSDSGDLVLEETVSKFSENHDYFTVPVEMEIETDSEFIIVPPERQASLLFYYTIDPIQFSMDAKVGGSTLESKENVSKNPFNNEEIKYIENFNLGDINIVHKHIISKTGFGIKRAYLAYDEKGLQLSHVTTDNPEYPVTGWVRL